MNRLFFLFLSLLLLPLQASAQAVFTEIMYDLEGSDTGREWIEVFNTSGAPIDFSLWRLYEANTNHKIVLFSGNSFVPAGGYAVIADNPEKFLIDWPDFQGTMFDSSFSLHNGGETLILRNEPLEDIYTVSYSAEQGGAGDGNSLQKIGADWAAAVPTPGAGADAPAPSTPAENNQQSEPAAPSNDSVYEPPQTIVVDAGVSKRIALVGAPVSFRASMYGLEGDPIDNARFVWSFGDGGIGEGGAIAHTYFYPGEYVVMLEGASGVHAAGDKVYVTVVPADIVIESVGASDDFFISIKNNTKYEINLEGWTLQSSVARFMIPRNTFLSSGKIVRFAPSITGLAHSEEVSLLYPNGSVASTYDKYAAAVSAPAVVVPKISYRAPSADTNIAPISAAHIQPVSEPADDADNFVEDAQAALPLSVEAKSGSSGAMKWIFALVALVAASLGGFFLMSRDSFEEKTARGNEADEFTITEEKNGH